MKYIDLSKTKHIQLFKMFKTDRGSVIRYYIDNKKREELKQYIGNDLLVNFGNNYDSFATCKLTYVENNADDDYDLYYFGNMQDVEYAQCFYQDYDFNEYDLYEEDKLIEFNYLDDDLQEDLLEHMNKDIIVILHDKIIIGTLDEVDKERKKATLLNINIFDKETN